MVHFLWKYIQSEYLQKKAKLEVIDSDRLRILMKSIIKLLSKIGKKKKFILMTSPNHLWTTYQNLDVKLADSYTKSIFSSTFQELENHNDVKYFPANEIFQRSTISKYRDDNIHVSNLFIKKILLKYFKEFFFK